MKRNILGVVIIFSSLCCAGQITQLTDDSIQYCGHPNASGIVKYPSFEGRYITPYSFNKLLRRDFSLITTNEEGLPSIGNYATLKFSENDTKISLNGSLYNIFINKDSAEPIKTIFSFGIKAGIKDGVSTLFSNNSVNNNVGLNFQYSILNWKKTKYEYRALDCGILTVRRGLIRAQYQNEGRKLEIKRDLLSKAIDDLRSERTKIDDTVKTIAAQITALANESNPPRDSLVRELTLKMEKMEQKSFALFDSIASLRNQYSDSYASEKSNKEKLEKTYLQKLYDLESSGVKWTAFRIKWVDIVGNISGSSYKLFNKADSIHKQIYKKNFQKFELGFNFNIFSSDSVRSFLKHGYLFKFSYRIGNDNNIKDANKRDIESIVLIDTPTFTRRVIEKVTVYEQVFKETFSHTLGFQFTKFLNEKRNYGISLYAKGVLSFKKFWEMYKIDGKPDISIGAGLFVTLLDKEKESGVINFELSARFLDILNSGDDESNFYSRNEIALKMGLPFQSIFLNQKK